MALADKLTSCMHRMDSDQSGEQIGGYEAIKRVIGSAGKRFVDFKIVSVEDFDDSDDYDYAAEVASLKEQLRTSKAGIKKAEKMAFENQSLKNQHEADLDNCAKLEAENARLRTENASLNGQLHALKEAHKESQIRIDNLESDIDALQSKPKCYKLTLARWEFLQLVADGEIPSDRSGRLVTDCISAGWIDINIDTDLFELTEAGEIRAVEARPGEPKPTAAKRVKAAEAKLVELTEVLDRREEQILDIWELANSSDTDATVGSKVRKMMSVRPVRNKMTDNCIYAH